MADHVRRPHEAYGYSWLQWQMPHRFNGQPMHLSHSLPGSTEYQARAMEHWSVLAPGCGVLKCDSRI